MNWLRNKDEKKKGQGGKKGSLNDQEYEAYVAPGEGLQLEMIPFSQQMSCSEFLDIRKLALKRIQEEMLAKLLPYCTLSPDFVILVLDSYTANMLGNLQIDFSEFYKRKVFQIEDLNKQRKRYPMTDVIYFIQPDHETIAKVIHDFPEEDEIPYDQYGQVHFAFTGHCPESFIESLAKAEKLSKRVASFIEVNTDFCVMSDNVFLAPQVTNVIS